MIVVFTKWFSRSNTSTNEVEPELELCSADIFWILHADDDQVEAIGITNEVVVDPIVLLVTRELP